MSGRRLLLLALLFLTVAPACAAAERGSITDRTLRWPDADEWMRVISLRDYNTRVVVTGTTVLGMAAGVLGCFALLRKRALMGDALSHATLPGIGLAFMASVAAGGTGKSLAALLVGATISGLLGLACILLIRNFSRLKEDTALGIVLSVFFGAGVAVLGVAQRMGGGHSAGLESFIYGKTASMTAADAMLIAGVAVVVLAACVLLFKEFRLLCFDSAYAAAQGWPALFLDVVMMALIVAVTVIGLQAVGLILVIALLIVPAAAARFWTERLAAMTIIAGLFGALSGLLGSAASALVPNLPSGAMIVLAGSALFLFSMAFGAARGVLVRWLNRIAFENKVRRQHLLRAAYELVEGDGSKTVAASGRATVAIPVAALLAKRSWSPGRLRTEIARAERAGLITSWPGGDNIKFTPDGFDEAAQLVRQHRMWELYLITHADIAPSHVDRDADAIEHVLGPEMIRELESLLDSGRAQPVPTSPHFIAAPLANPGKGN
ncbi:MAG: iron chelate uptake ABC transporter family permease subunit [Chthoniobacteraceae bacterium]